MRPTMPASLVFLCIALTAMIGSARAGAGSREVPAGIRAVMALEDGVAYQGHDIRLRLTFSNPTPTLMTLPGDVVDPGCLSLTDGKGSTVTQQRIEPVSHRSDIPVQGYDTVSVVLALSDWYPKIASKKREWTVSWSCGSLEAPPFHFKVIDEFDPRKDTVALIETDLGKMRWELLPEAAPEHVKQFVDLARQGFYDGLTFHRYIPGLLLEGGDPKGDGTGAWQRLMPPEISRDLEMEPGLVAASRRSTSMTSDSMFFITLGPSPFMKGVHTFFARVEDGWTTIARFNQIPNKGRTGYPDEFLLLEPVTIQSVTIK